jgi:tetratricopeptide (TPR) repeat protein
LSAIRPSKAAIPALFLAVCGCTGSDPGRPGSGEPVTFTQHLAPVVFEHCSPCHRPGESGPFDLLTYQETRARAEQNVEATRNGFMPPWQPERGVVEFIGQRRLSAEQIDLFRRWFEGGMPEGDSRHLPQMPEWVVGWQRGKPDLLLEPAETYTLRADGIDVYHTLVVPIPIETARYVRAIDLRPANPQAVHHAVMRIDRSRSARMMDAAHKEEFGYPGMEWGEAQPPQGRFLGWTPGKMAYAGPDDSWLLEPDSDLVLQLHMVPVGKPEPIRPRIGLYFTDEPPQSQRETILLDIRRIDIPAGEREHVLEESYEIPVPVSLINVYPHAHYIGKRMLAWAVLPDGTERPLLRIENWDFSWQDQYYYAEQIDLPAGTTLATSISYDNSEDNPNNPFHPPQRIIGGDRSTDEMGAMSFEVMLQLPEDRELLEEALLRQDLIKWPNYWLANGELGTLLLNRGDYRQAVELLMKAVSTRKDYVAGYNNLGAALSHLGNRRGAVANFRRAIDLRPQYADAHYNLAVELAAMGLPDQAIEHYRQALEIRSYDADLHNNMGVALAMQGEPAEALLHFRRALAIDPDSADALGNLGTMLLDDGSYESAIEHYRRALEIRPDSEDLQVNLAEALRRQKVRELTSPRED